MIHCMAPRCTWKNVSLQRLHDHLSKYHGNLKVYECNVVECTRKFNVKCSFYRHLKTHFSEASNIKANNPEDIPFSMLNDSTTAYAENYHLATDQEQISHTLSTPEPMSVNDPTQRLEDLLCTTELDALIQQMQHASIDFNLKYLNANTVPRKTVFDIQKDIKLKIIDPFSKAIDVMRSLGLLTEEGKIVFNKMLSSVNALDSEYKYLAKLKELDLFVDPKEFVISNELQPGIVHNEQMMDSNPVTGIILPLEFTLRKYLESKGVMSTVMNNITPSSDGIIRTILDGSVWKTRTIGLGSRLVIPLNLFFDDFTTTDTVSPHAARTSVCGIYCYIPCMPANVLTKLENIHVVSYVLSEDRKEYDNEQLFSNLVNALIKLETKGLEITYNGEKVNVYFMVGNITGDNLGLSGILDLVESARANYYCRLCKRNREQREYDTIEYEDSFRTVDNYQEDLLKDEVSLTGVKSNSIFNQIPSFHVVHNVYFDMMHDLWEGVCVYGLGHYFNYFIKTKKFFSLDDLNYRKNLFVFGKLNSSNIPDDIKDINISKCKVKMTASEIKTLVTFLPLIIGNLVPEDDPVWNHFCILLKICHILMLREISVQDLNILRKLVSTHHAQYITLFNDKLKPKHHNLVHYATFILCSGTPRHQWTMRGEAKHREAKQYSRVNNNKINLCKSLGIKASLKFAFNLFNNSFIPPSIDLSSSKLSIMHLKTEYVQLLNDCKIDNNAVKYVDKFIKHGLEFARNTVFYIRQNDLASIYELEDIILDNDEKLVMVCHNIHSRCFNNHFQSYEVYKTMIRTVFIDIEYLETCTIDLHKVEEKLYLRCCNLMNVINNV
ncbi:uncharacterized protein LOC110676430 [Aedes aegypti]|uniref:Uncharacterized protein n=1 Tax=Aedes aegypti TaxID=7159 RepID=A0A6I8TSI3_AEDAE|nr:uncharacterized protein LOC110676430 [Aedes aegypti]